MSNYTAIDIYWDLLGDITIDPIGDVLDTSTDKLRSLVQEIRTRVQSDYGDWGIYPKMKVLAFKDFLGKPNTKELGERIKERIISVLTYDGLIMRGDLIVIVAPINNRAMAIRLGVNCTGTPGATNTIDIRYIYDTKEQELLAL